MTDNAKEKSKKQIATLQMTSTADVNQNLAVAERLISQAAANGAGLVLLPENFAVFSSKDMRNWAEKEQRLGVFTSFLSSMAKAYHVWIVGGTVPMLPEGDLIQSGMIQGSQGIESSLQKVRTSTLVYDDQGGLRGRYDKIHLFDVSVSDGHGRYCESDVIESGVEPVVIESPFGRLGLSICYDVRFPELYAKLLSMGAEVLLVPSAFTWVTGRAHWEILLRARAIENQCYVVAANQGGEHSPNRRTWGHSMIIDPWGEVMGVSDEGESVLIKQCDLASVQKVRENMPVQQHKRFSVISRTPLPYKGETDD